MNDAALVRGLEGFTDLNRNVENFFNRHRTPRNPVLQRFAFNQFKKG